jgi:hypothetical protein
MKTQLSSRRELRHTFRQNGTYLKSLTNGDRTAFEDGPVTILNKSENGARLQMSRPFDAGDIIEVQWRQPGEQSTTEVFEARWSQRKHSSRYIIGCRLIFSTEWRLRTKIAIDAPITQSTLLKADEIERPT